MPFCMLSCQLSLVASKGQQTDLICVFSHFLNCSADLILLLELRPSRFVSGHETHIRQLGPFIHDRCVQDMSAEPRAGHLSQRTRSGVIPTSLLLGGLESWHIEMRTDNRLGIPTNHFSCLLQRTQQRTYCFSAGTCGICLGPRPRSRKSSGRASASMSQNGRAPMAFAVAQWQHLHRTPILHLDVAVVVKTNGIPFWGK